MNKIDSVGFGVMGIGGKKYRMRDVMIFPDGTIRHRKCSRWLGSHHKYGKEDIRELITSGAEIVVVGTGIFSRVKLSDEIREYTRNLHCELAELPSRQAMQYFNEQMNNEKRVGALIHILC